MMLQVKRCGALFVPFKLFTMVVEMVTKEMAIMFAPNATMIHRLSMVDRPVQQGRSDALTVNIQRARLQVVHLGETLKCFLVHFVPSPAIQINQSLSRRTLEVLSWLAASLYLAKIDVHTPYGFRNSANKCQQQQATRTRMMSVVNVLAWTR
jgi:hypothetical protein